MQKHLNEHNIVFFKKTVSFIPAWVLFCLGKSYLHSKTNLNILSAFSESALFSASNSTTL